MVDWGTARGYGARISQEGEAMDAEHRCAISEHDIDLHGRTMRVRTAGSGPAVLLVHGMLSSSETWTGTIDRLASGHRLVAPDLFGHGRSDAGSGDYSLGAQAAGLRDLAVRTGLERFTIVGHSLGGGVALQFAYQFPEFVERLVLVGAGGLGRRVSLLIRASSLPGSELVLPLVGGSWVRNAGEWVFETAGKLGWEPPAPVSEMWRGVVGLGDRATRTSFLRTVRSVVDRSGQAVSAADRLHLAAMLPTLIVWGQRDTIIPVGHAHRAHAAISGSHLEIFEQSGHWPHLSEPHRFASVLREFLEGTEAARLSFADVGKGLNVATA